jgi:hypothetical protein
MQAPQLGTQIVLLDLGREGVENGIAQYCKRRDLSLVRMLFQPLVGLANAQALAPCIMTKELLE